MCWRIVAYLAISLLLLVGCSSPPHLSGYLYAFSNNNFTVVDLNTGKIIANAVGPKTVSFLYAAKIDDRTILLSGFEARPNGRSVSVKLDHRTVRFVSGGAAIWLYNRFTGELTPYLLSPRYPFLGIPVYMPKYKSMIFYCGKNRLCRAPADDTGNVIVADPNDADDDGLGGWGYYPIVAVSDDEVLYITNNDRVKYYNLATDKVGYLPFGKCVPQLWRSKTQQLLCLAFQPKAHYYFIKLDGTEKARAPNFDDGTPAIYLPDYDTVIAGGLQLKWYFPDPIPYEWSILRAYNLTSGSVHAFASGSWMSQGDTAWFPDVPKDIPGITLAEPTQITATPLATLPNAIGK